MAVHLIEKRSGSARIHFGLWSNRNNSKSLSEGFIILILTTLRQRCFLVQSDFLNLKQEFWILLLVFSNSSVYSSSFFLAFSASSRSRVAHWCVLWSMVNQCLCSVACLRSWLICHAGCLCGEYYWRLTRNSYGVVTISVISSQNPPCFSTSEISPPQAKIF